MTAKKVLSLALISASALSISLVSLSIIKIDLSTVDFKKLITSVVEIIGAKNALPINSTDLNTSHSKTNESSPRFSEKNIANENTKPNTQLTYQEKNDIIEQKPIPYNKDDENQEFSAPPAQNNQIKNLNGQSIDPNQSSYYAPPAATIEGLNGIKAYHQ